MAAVEVLVLHGRLLILHCFGRRDGRGRCTGLRRDNRHGERQAERQEVFRGEGDAPTARRSTTLLVASAAGANGAGYGNDGEPIGVFGNDPRVVDPRGLAVNRFWRKAVVGRFVYLRFCIGRIMCPG